MLLLALEEGLVVGAQGSPVGKKYSYTYMNTSKALLKTDVAHLTVHFTHTVTPGIGAKCHYQLLKVICDTCLSKKVSQQPKRTVLYFFHHILT